MKLGRKFEIVDGLPVLYVKSLNALVCSDLHLGYEGVMAEKGFYLPKMNLKRIKSNLADAKERTGATRIIIDGDIKNEFSKVHFEEASELRELVNYLRTGLKIDTITLVKGNHDNFVDRMKLGEGVGIFSDEILIDRTLFFHGHGLPSSKSFDALIMGHVHPAITIYNDVGIKEKLHCFLYGKTRGGADVIVLPAMNYFAGGVGVNVEDISRMAPVFRTLANVKDMHAMCIGDGETLDFGTIRELAALR